MKTVNVTDNLTLDDLLKTAEEMNMTSVETLDLLYGALGIVKGRNKRVFSFTDPMDAAQPPTCRADFVRSFEHTDWIDGESIVQAEATSMEEGFNARFHKIEGDLDALAADIAKCFVCVGDQRAAIAKALDEIKAELNRINADIYDCCVKDSGGSLGYPKPDIEPGYVIPPFVIPPVVGPKPWEPPWVSVGPVGPWPYPEDIWRRPDYVTTPWGPDVQDPVRAYIETIKGYQTYEGISSTIVRSKSDPSRGVVAGLQARLIEETTFNGQAVEVWSTSAGVILTPLAEKGAVKEARAAWTNPRIDVTARFARWAADNEEAVRRKLGDEFTISSFVKSFGEEKIEGGIRIADVVDRLASDFKGNSPLSFVAPLAEANGKAIVREGFASETVIGAVGLNAGAKGSIKEVAVSTIKSLSKEVVAGMRRAGIRSLGQLAAMSAPEIAERMRAAGVEVSLGQAATYSAEAATVAAVDRFARGAGEVVNG